MIAAGSSGHDTLEFLPQIGELVRLDCAGVELRARVVLRDAALLALRLLPGDDDLPASPPRVAVCVVERADALYRFRAVASRPSAILSATVPTTEEQLWWFELDPSSRDRVQRREFFRMRLSLPLLVPRAKHRDLLGLSLGALPVLTELSGADYRLFRSIDLSGGGCLLEGVEPWLRAGSEHRGYLYVGDDGGPLPLELIVIRSTAEPSPGQTAIRFTRLPERRRERILRALYREHRRQRALRPESA